MEKKAYLFCLKVLPEYGETVRNQTMSRAGGKGGRWGGCVGGLGLHQEKEELGRGRGTKRNLQEAARTPDPVGKIKGRGRKGKGVNLPEEAKPMGGPEDPKKIPRFETLRKQKIREGQLGRKKTAVGDVVA